MKCAAFTLSPVFDIEGVDAAHKPFTVEKKKKKKKKNWKTSEDKRNTCAIKGDYVWITEREREGKQNARRALGDTPLVNKDVYFLWKNRLYLRHMAMIPILLNNTFERGNEIVLLHR